MLLSQRRPSHTLLEPVRVILLDSYSFLVSLLSISVHSQILSLGIFLATSDTVLAFSPAVNVSRLVTVRFTFHSSLSGFVWHLKSLVIYTSGLGLESKCFCIFFLYIGNLNLSDVFIYIVSLYSSIYSCR